MLGIVCYLAQDVLCPGPIALIASIDHGMCMKHDTIVNDERRQKDNRRTKRRDRLGRSYKTSTLPTLRECDAVGRLSPNQLTLLLGVYGETGANWRALHDVRFKLLALIPIVTVAIMTAVFFQSDLSSARSWMVVAVGVVGALKTCGLAIYEKRNSELYDDLISRGRRIEKELGLDTGVFLGRRKPSNPVLNHSTGIKLVYCGALFGWVSVIVAGSSAIWLKGF